MNVRKLKLMWNRTDKLGGHLSLNHFVHAPITVTQMWY
ncbi:hypothetical protein SPONN_1639 [uncultured Candidatus Thioglobus sp.]|nr:hypothetical protein SPONN_1639 [uncultured Candidatus Thioglobus sp.]